MANEIMRVYENDSVVIYKRLGNIKNFAPLARYFLKDTAQEFKSIAQVKKFIKDQEGYCKNHNDYCYAGMGV